MVGSIRPYLDFWRPPVSGMYSEADAGPGAEADAGPGAEAEAGFRDYKNFFVQYSMCCSIGAAGFRPSSRAHDAGLSPCQAAALRPEHHP
jgi:hypothetical protein